MSFGRINPIRYDRNATHLTCGGRTSTCGAYAFVEQSTTPESANELFEFLKTLAPTPASPEMVLDCVKFTDFKDIFRGKFYKVSTSFVFSSKERSWYKEQLQLSPDIAKKCFEIFSSCS